MLFFKLSFQVLLNLTTQSGFTTTTINKQFFELFSCGHAEGLPNVFPQHNLRAFDPN